MKMKMQLIQTKLMKVFVNWQNLMNKEFQHWAESALIEMIKMKMQMIQFMSSMHLMKVGDKSK
jgi:hypothetical protein